MSDFLRFYRGKEHKEILINVNSIWKIEVTYVKKVERGYVELPLEQGLSDENALRHYRVFAGSEEVKVVSNPDDPVVKVLEEIYKGAIKR